MGKKQKVEEEQQDQTAEELRDAAWDELDAAENKKPEDEGLPVDTDPEGKGDKTDSQVAPTDSETLKNEEEKLTAEQAAAKALKDTKAFATKLSQENAELKRLIAEGATKKEIAEQEKTVETAKASISDETLSTVYREYPELKEVLSPLLDTLKGLQSEVEATKQDKARQAQDSEAKRKQDALDYFESTIMPKVTEVHADFKEIIGDAAYFEWAEKQRPGLKTAALSSNDPEDIKWAIGEYKKSLAGVEAGKIKQTDEEKRKEKLNNQMTLRGGSSPLPTGSNKVDPNDYDAAWEKLDKEDAKK